MKIFKIFFFFLVHSHTHTKYIFIKQSLDKMMINKSESTASNNDTKPSNGGGLLKSANKKLKKVDDVTSKELAAETTRAPQVKYDAKMLESFWKLSEYDPKVRMEGIKLLADYFGKLDPNENSDAYNYILMRLVRGLASNRKCSRLGFSTALTELLIRFDTLQFEKVLDLAEKNLNVSAHEPKANGSSSSSNKTKKNSEQAIIESLATLSKEEIRHMHIGMVFVYFCWLKANRLEADYSRPFDSLSKKQLDLIDQIIGKLNEMRKSREIKDYIQQFYFNAFTMLVKKCLMVNRSLFDEKIMPLIRDDLNQLNSSSSSNSNNNSTDDYKDSIHILISCLNVITSGSIDKNGFKAHDLICNKLRPLVFKPSNHSHLYDIICKSSDLLPNVQPFCVDLVEYGMRAPKEFSDFWLNVIDAKLFVRKEPEKKLVGYKLYLICLRNLNEANYDLMFDSCLLKSANLQKTLINNLLLKASNINEIVKRTFAIELVDFIGLNETRFVGKSFGADLIIGLLGYAQKSLHDISDLICSSILKMNEQSLAKFYAYLIGEYEKCESELGELNVVDESRANDREDAGENETTSRFRSLQMRKMWLINQMTNLSKNPALFNNVDLLDKLISSLLKNSYFKSAGKKSLKCVGKTSNKCLVQMRDSLFKYFGLLINRNESKMNGIVMNGIKLIESCLGKTNQLVDGDEQLSEEKKTKRIGDLAELCKRINKLNEKIVKLFKREEEDMKS